MNHDQMIEARGTALAEMEAAETKLREADTDEAREEARQEWQAAEAEVKRIDENLAIAKRTADLRYSAPELPTPAPVPTPAAPSPDVRVGEEPLTYGRKMNHSGTSILRDIHMAQRHGDREAAERLERHSKEMTVELRDQTTTDTTSIGEMIPPLWLVERFAAIARAGRPLANAIGSMDLPPGTENIIVPKVTTGGSVHFQTAQNTAIAEQDMVTGGTAQATVKTIAGQIDTSLQSVEWAPINLVDSMFLPELASLHANRMEVTVGGAAATPTNGWAGIIGTSGTQAVTYTSAAPTAGSLYSKVADAIQQIDTNRYLPADLIVMHPRRWAALLAATDSTGRPLIVPYTQNPQNAMATHGGVVSEGFVGEMQGVPVLKSAAAIPTADAAGTTNDVVLVVRKEDLWLWESPIRTRILYEVLSGALTVRIQLYNYSAFMPDRYPTAISSIRGTGLSTPTF